MAVGERLAVGVAVLLVNFAVGVSIAVAIGVPVGGVAISGPIRVAIAVPVGCFQSQCLFVSKKRKEKKTGKTSININNKTKKHKQSNPFENQWQLLS